VGVDITGQQGGFIQCLQREMEYRGNFFNLAQEKGKPGIRPTTDKLSRFNLVVPLFKAGKVRFPLELKQTQVLGIFMEQISLATKDGIKGKDDCLDTVSMLQFMNAWTPNPDTIPEEQMDSSQVKDAIWGFEPDPEYESGIDSYLV
jgi:hypothetical protein